MADYRTVEQAAKSLNVSARTIRNYCDEFSWFGGRLGDSSTWVITQPEIDRMLKTPRKAPGRPRKPVFAGSN